MRHDSRLEIRLLGDLQVLRAGRLQPLPASKKTRALLGYLVATATPHLRERLCDLFWEGPDDPRAALRWSLTKIRPLLNDAAAPRLLTDRERVAFEARDTEIDAARVRALLGSNIAAASSEALKAAVGLFRGEFLDGLDLPSCYRYHEWCMGEREALNAARLAALGALVARLGDRPDEALGYARAMVAADPLSEASHAAVVRVLGELGRVRAALDHYEYARRVLESELAAPLSGELEQARRAVHAPSLSRPGRVPCAPSSSAEDPTAPPRPAETGPIPLVGRRVECDLLDGSVAAAGRGQARQVVLICGEPGIGKSRMLAHGRERVLRAGGTVLGARAFEAEMVRPYGAWIDLLRAVPLDDVPSGARGDLALLLPELGTPAADSGTRLRLFDSVVALLRHVAAERMLAVLFDDVHWLDEASASLLHYVVRAFAAPSTLLFICAARRGELEDNAALLRVTQSLAREHRLVELGLGPLAPADAVALAHAVDPSSDPAVVAESEGNPLFILELARARRGGEDVPSRTLDALIMGHLARVDAPARDLLVWAAALGRRFTLDLLTGAAGLQTADLLAALGELERRGILRPTAADEYDFTHDLIRQAAYRSVSQPRRKLVHRQIARVVAAKAEADDSLAGDLAHHAALAGEDALAAAACVTAGERCLRLFANAEAAALAERGLRHLDKMPPGAHRLRLHIALLKVKILAVAGPGLRRLPEVAEELTQAVSSAEAAGLYAEAANGYYLLSVLQQEAGEPGPASESTLRAAEAAAAADRATHARQLANTARCLAELEREMARARALLQEAEAIIQPLGPEIPELYWGQGLLQRWDGDLETASSSLDRALGLARRAENRWREYKCLTWLAIVDLERGELGRAQARCVEVGQVAARMGDQDVPFAQAIMALAELAAGKTGAGERLASALAALREIDDKSHLAYALNAAAGIYLAGGGVAAAQALAGEALAAAKTVRRRGEAAIAESTLARAALASGDPREAADRVARLVQEAADPHAVSARARAAIAVAAQAAGRRLPTAIQTVSDES